MPSHTSWGMLFGEESLPFPCDAVADTFDGIYFRGITIHAEPAVIFQWLTQMRIAPYSYDWINNLGRTSPRRLLKDQPDLRFGQTMMHIFDVVQFNPSYDLTLRVKSRSFGKFLFGDILLSYRIISIDDHSSRLLVKIKRKFNRGPLGFFMRYFLPWANLIMHRKQLMLFKELSENK
ncbi:hypothetical protein F9K33_11150 [bacterium]|nr:MAG: hypothetical protein F9K33_11150 [bacterium]